MSNKMALDALQLAYIAMQHMGNVLNNIDAVDEEEDAQHDAAFEAVRAAIAALQAEPQGWMPIETAPVNTQVVALFRGEMPVIAHKNAPNDSPAGWCHAFATRDYFDHPTRGLTHWMPLPTPPKD